MPNLKKALDWIALPGVTGSLAMMSKAIRYVGVILMAAGMAFPPGIQAATEQEAWNVFYLDLDQDSFGDPKTQMSFASPAPPNRLWVPFGDDPDDKDTYAYPLPVAKGARTLGLNFAQTASDGRVRSDLARELGAGAAMLDLAWGTLETAPGKFRAKPTAALENANTLYPRDGFALSLSIDPLDAASLSLPDDLRTGIEQGTLAWSSAKLRDRMHRLLDFIHAKLADTELVSLQIGNDLDLYQQKVPDAVFWSEYLRFFQDAAAYARTLWGADLKVAVTFSQAGVTRIATTPSLRALLDASDFLSLNYLTGPEHLPPGGLSVVGDDLAAAVALAGNKPVAYRAVGFPTSATVGASETLQSQFFRMFFSVWDRYADPIFFVGFTRLFDLSTAQASQYEASARPYIKSLGLRNAGGGSAKAGYDSLRNAAFERGWWRAAPARSRPYHLGFTPMPYDTPPDTAGQQVVAAYIDTKLAAEADLFAIHLDSGIPWTEALADPWTSTTPPYSNSLMASWSLYKSRIPQGHKVLVSISPMGIPRNLLAPYWGYGQGFTFTSDFRRVGDGVFADGENRLPPPPFDGYSLDHDDVKHAFLSYAERVIEYFHPDYLCLAIEASAAQVRDANAYAKYLDLQRFVYQSLKANPRYAQIPLLVSISATSFMTDEYGHLVRDWRAENSVAYKYDEMEAGVRKRLVQGLKDLLPYVDMLGLSIYPHYGKYNAYRVPASSYDSLFATLKQAGLGDKPVAVTESGYPGNPYNLFKTNLFAASPEKQAMHLKLLFYELNKQPNPVAFVVNFQVRDTDQAWQRGVDSGADPLFSEFHKYFRDIGLYDGKGKARPSATLWRSQLSLPFQPKTLPAPQAPAASRTGRSAIPKVN